MALFGGYSNTLMSTTTHQVINYIQKQIAHISYTLIKEFNQLFPPILTENIYENLYKNINKLYDQKRQLTLPFEEVGLQIAKKAKMVSEEFQLTIRKMLDNQYIKQHFKKIYESSLTSETLVINKINFESSIGKIFDNNFSARLKYLPYLQNKQIPKIDNSTKFLAYETCQNLLYKPSCVCISKKQMVIKDANSFRCKHCFKLYHTLCMKKKEDAEYCAYCHLQKMAPLKKVIHTVFIGLLKKNTKKHSAQFHIPELNPNQKIQVRCLRLKQQAQKACLFPDVAEISINNQRCNSFEPINKQSCLKYRKDEPFVLLRSDFFQGKKNRLQVSQILQQNKQKQVRNESENHLLGIYVIQQLKIDTLITQTRIQRTLGFSQSKHILQSNLQLKNNDQITFQLVKIPLNCPLTRQKIDNPVRGIYCRHFQCFDLKNYITMISESTNPRWKCPICDVLAYQLQIDPILMKIITAYKYNQKIDEILFYKNGDYLPLIDGQPSEEKKNISELNIPERIRINTFQNLQKPRKRNIVVPSNVQVIEISDD